MRIWAVMDDCIRVGVTTNEKTLPGRLGLRRRAPMLYRRLMRGYIISPFLYDDAHFMCFVVSTQASLCLALHRSKSPINQLG